MSQNNIASVDAAGNDAIAPLRRENAQLRQRVAELERLVSIDTLTPLYNRRHFMEELDRWCWRAHRYGGSYGLLFCDIDRFKAVNDIQGHAIGDEVLCGVADHLAGAVRKSDVVARLGGDEFSVLLDSITEDRLEQKTAAMIAAMTKLGIATSGPLIHVGVSVGSALISRDSRPADVLAQADQAMYLHKRSKYPA